LQKQLGILPAERRECALLACEALISAIRNFSDTARDEWEGDALICTCFCVSERTIEREIQEKRLRQLPRSRPLVAPGRLPFVLPFD